MIQIYLVFINILIQIVLDTYSYQFSGHEYIPTMFLIYFSGYSTITSTIATFQHCHDILKSCIREHHEGASVWWNRTHFVPNFWQHILKKGKAGNEEGSDFKNISAMISHLYQEGELYSVHYDQRKELGRGKFGVVYHVKVQVLKQGKFDAS